MALTDAQWAAEVADIVARLVAGTITEAQAASELASATLDWPTRSLSNADLAQRVSRFLARLNGLILTDGPPGAALGELNTFAYDTANGALYGPKTAAGWGVPVSLVGPAGPAGQTGPRGDRGEAGETGAQGPIGNTGSQGSVGSAGPQGLQGPIGNTGPQGERGETGLTGPQGMVGETGLAGPQGETGETGATGPQGPVGPIGPQGPVGPIGPQGVKGDRGEAFTVDAQGTLAGRNAHDGEAVGFSYLDTDAGNLYFRVTGGGWSPPIPFGKGEQGDVGPQGPAGATGPQGPQGLDGATGPQGPQGEIGATGAPGPAGADGADGADGSPGNDATVTFASAAEVRAGTATTKAISPKAQADADGYVPISGNGAFTIDLSSGSKFTVSLSANSTMSFTGGHDGKDFVIRFVQPASGGPRTLALNSAIRKVGAYTLSTAANAIDRCGGNVVGSVVELTALEKGLSS